MSFENGIALVDIGYACYAIPKFYGEEEKFNDWLSKVERVFACCDLNDQDKFKVVLSRMRGYVLHWWQSYMAQRKKYGKKKVRTWTKMKRELMSVFCSPPYEDTLLKEGSSKPTPTPTAPISFPPQKNQTPQESQTLFPYPSGEAKLEEKEEKEGEYVEEKNEEDEGKKLTFTTPHPPKDKAEHTILFIAFGEATPILSSIPPPPQALNKNFCQVQPLMSHTQTSMGKNNQQVLKFKQDLFGWLILFQPDL